MFIINHAEFVVAVPPSYLNGLELLAAEEVLDSRLLTFDERLGGLLISYEKLRFAEKGLGLVQDEQPDILFRFKANLVIFCPKKGDKFSGTASDIQAGHVTLLIGGVFPVIVKADSFPKGVSLSEDNTRSLIDNNGDVFLSIGSVASLKCTRVQTKNGTLFVEAAFYD